MIRATRRQWRYMTAWLRRAQETHADPQVQLEQAVEDAQRQHQALQQQAAAVLTNQHQLQIQLGRSLDDVEKLKAATAQALRLADQAQRGGDTARAKEYEDTARGLATNLSSAEESMEGLKGLHDKALVAADNAKRAVQQNRMLLQETMAQRSKLLTQLEQARMQERMNAAMRSMTSSALEQPPGDTPTLDEVRVKIEQRYARALGSAELSSSSMDARMLEVQQSMLQSRGDARLAEIRSSLALGDGGADRLAISEPRGITDGSEHPEATAAPEAAHQRRSTSRRSRKTPD